MSDDRQIYLDYNATAPARPEVIQKVVAAMGLIGNPNSVHRAGRGARDLVETARAQVASLVNADPANVIFTSGGTEADNLALRTFGARRLIVSAIEHGAILAPAMIHDPNCIILPVDENGLISPAILEDALSRTDGPALVSIMLANNETGVIEPLAALAEVAHAHDAVIHCDAVQAAGKIDIDIMALGVDCLSLSAHKIGGPQGVGAFILSHDRALIPQLIGGGQEKGRRSGTENVAGIAGFGEAAELAKGGLADAGRIEGLRNDLEQAVKRYSNDVIVFGETVPRLPNTSNLTMPGVRSDLQVMSFDLEGFAVSAGSACSSGKVSASHVLDAMGIPEDIATTAIRVSLGHETSRADVDGFLAAWKKIYDRQHRAPDAA